MEGVHLRRAAHGTLHLLVGRRRRTDRARGGALVVVVLREVALVLGVEHLVEAVQGAAELRLAARSQMHRTRVRVVVFAEVERLVGAAFALTSLDADARRTGIEQVGAWVARRLVEGCDTDWDV